MSTLSVLLMIQYVDNYLVSLYILQQIKCIPFDNTELYEMMFGKICRPDFELH